MALGFASRQGCALLPLVYTVIFRTIISLLSTDLGQYIMPLLLQVISQYTPTWLALNVRPHL